MSTDSKNTNIKKSDQRRSKIRRQFGASLVEYGLLVSLIALAAVPAVKLTGMKVGVNLCKGAVGKQNGVTYSPTSGCYSFASCAVGNAFIGPNGSITCLP